MSKLLAWVVGFALLATTRAALPARAQAPEMSRELREAIRERMIARERSIDKARGGPNNIPLSRSLPDSLSPDLHQVEGFVRAQRIPGSELAIDDSGARQAGLQISDVFDDEEWVRLPEGASIRRELIFHPLGRYEIWHYPPGTRIAHLVYLKASRELFEFRLALKLDDEAAGSDGPWALGIFRPVRGDGRLRLYTLKKGERDESPMVHADAPGGPRQFRVTRIHPESCRSCHSMHGDGWYQYADEDHAGPCGFVPANASILATWAPAYQRRHGYFPFTGP